MNFSVSDEQVVANIQDIRNATWGKLSYASLFHPGCNWFITITYKGSHNTFYYKTEVEARSIFNKIRTAIDQLSGIEPTFLRCSKCGKCVSTAFYAVPTDTPDKGLIVRAYIACPECIEKDIEQDAT